MNTFTRSPVKRIRCVKREKYHGSSFLYADGEFKMQHSEQGSSVDIVNKKLSRWEASMKDWKPPVKEEPEVVDEDDCLPFW